MEYESILSPSLSLFYYKSRAVICSHTPERGRSLEYYANLPFPEDNPDIFSCVCNERSERDLIHLMEGALRLNTYLSISPMFGVSFFSLHNVGTQQQQSPPPYNCLKDPYNCITALPCQPIETDWCYELEYCKSQRPEPQFRTSPAPTRLDERYCTMFGSEAPEWRPRSLQRTCHHVRAGMQGRAGREDWGEHHLILSLPGYARYTGGAANVEILPGILPLRSIPPVTIFIVKT
jgi:hypothetical protein